MEKIFYAIGAILLIISFGDFIKNPRKVLNGFKVFRYFRWWQIPLAIFTVVCLITCVAILHHFVPILSYGWTNIFSRDSGGSVLTPVFSPSKELASSFPVIEIMSILFLVGFILLIPKINAWEEEEFRRGITRFPEIFISNLIWASFHLITGISLATMLAIFGLGLFYSLIWNIQFRKTKSSDTATSVLTCTHVMHNYVCFAVIITILIIK